MPSTARDYSNLCMHFRYMSALKDQRVAAEKFYSDLGLGGITAGAASVDKAQLISDVKDALYAAKICSYAQVRSQCFILHLLFAR